MIDLRSENQQASFSDDQLTKEIRSTSTSLSKNKKCSHSVSSLQPYHPTVITSPSHATSRVHLHNNEGNVDRNLLEQHKIHSDVDVFSVSLHQPSVGSHSFQSSVQYHMPPPELPPICHTNPRSASPPSGSSEKSFKTNQIHSPNWRTNYLDHSNVFHNSTSNRLTVRLSSSSDSCLIPEPHFQPRTKWASHPSQKVSMLSEPFTPSFHERVISSSKLSFSNRCASGQAHELSMKGTPEPSTYMTESHPSSFNLSKPNFNNNRFRRISSSHSTQLINNLLENHRYLTNEEQSRRQRHSRKLPVAPRHFSPTPDESHLCKNRSSSEDFSNAQHPFTGFGRLRERHISSSSENNSSNGDYLRPQRSSFSIPQRPGAHPLDAIHASRVEGVTSSKIHNKSPSARVLLATEVKKRHALENENRRLHAMTAQKAAEEKVKTEDLKNRLYHMQCQMHGQRDNNQQKQVGWDSLAGFLWDTTSMQNTKERWRTRHNQVVAPKYSSGCKNLAGKDQRVIEANRRELPSRNSRREMTILQERERNIRELEATIIAQSARASRMEKRMESLTASLEESQAAFDCMIEQKNEKLRQADENRNRERAILLGRLERANEEREQQEALITQAAVTLDERAKDIAILKGDLLSRKKDLREANERFKLLESRMYLLHDTKQTFFGFRVLSSDRRIPVALGLVEGYAGTILLRISTTGDQTLVKLAHVQHVDILFPPKKSSQLATRLKVQTISMGAFLFDMLNEVEAQRCYFLLTTLGSAACRMEKQKHDASNRACLAQLETFFFGGTLTDIVPPELPEPGNLESLIDFIQEEDLIASRDSLRSSLCGSVKKGRLENSYKKGRYIAPVLSSFSSPQLPVRPSTTSTSAQQLIEFSQYLQKFQGPSFPVKMTASQRRPPRGKRHLRAALPSPELFSLAQPQESGTTQQFKDTLKSYNLSVGDRFHGSAKSISPSRMNRMDSQSPTGKQNLQRSTRPSASRLDCIFERLKRKANAFQGQHGQLLPPSSAAVTSSTSSNNIRYQKTVTKEEYEQMNSSDNYRVARPLDARRKKLKHVSPSLKKIVSAFPSSASMTPRSYERLPSSNGSHFPSSDASLITPNTNSTCKSDLMNHSIKPSHEKLDPLLQFSVLNPEDERNSCMGNNFQKNFPQKACKQSIRQQEMVGNEMPFLTSRNRSSLLRQSQEHTKSKSSPESPVFRERNVTHIPPQTLTSPSLSPNEPPLLTLEKQLLLANHNGQGWINSEEEESSLDEHLSSNNEEFPEAVIVTCGVKPSPMKMSPSSEPAKSHGKSNSNYQQQNFDDIELHVGAIEPSDACAPTPTAESIVAEQLVLPSVTLTGGKHSNDSTDEANHESKIDCEGLSSSMTAMSVSIEDLPSSDHDIESAQDSSTRVLELNSLRTNISTQQSIRRGLTSENFHQAEVGLPAQLKDGNLISDSSGGCDPETGIVCNDLAVRADSDPERVMGELFRLIEVQRGVDGVVTTSPLQSGVHSGAPSDTGGPAYSNNNSRISTGNSDEREQQSQYSNSMIATGNRSASQLRSISSYHHQNEISDGENTEPELFESTMRTLAYLSTLTDTPVNDFNSDSVNLDSNESTALNLSNTLRIDPESSSTGNGRQSQDQQTSHFSSSALPFLRELEPTFSESHQRQTLQDISDPQHTSEFDRHGNDENNSIDIQNVISSSS